MRAALAAAMPAMLAHEGEWDGHYRHIGLDGELLDLHRVWTRCEFPAHGPDAYIQHNRLSWPDGCTADYRFGAALRDGRLWWETDRFCGHGWQTDDVIMLRLERRDVPDAHYIEMITIAPDGQSRARTWQWFRSGQPWKRTLCDERRIG